MFPEYKPQFNFAESFGSWGPQNYTSVDLAPTLDLSTQALQTQLAPVTDATVMPVTPLSFGQRAQNWMKDSGFLGSKGTDGTQYQGWGGLALGAANGLANLWLGMQNYGLAKKQLNFQKDAFNKNYTAQRNLTNSSLEDRQRRRNLENPGSTPVAEYMAKYGLK